VSFYVVYYGNEKREKTMNSENKEKYQEGLDNLIEGIKQNYLNWTNPYHESVEPTMKEIKLNSVKRFNDGMKITLGQKYDKVIQGSSVWGFVAKQDGMLKGIPYFVGDVFKAAGWAAPAKHVRGSIFNTEQNWFQWTGPNYL